MFSCRGGDKHIDSSSDSELDMPGMMSGGGNSQGLSKQGPLGNSNMTANLQHNLLLQQGLAGSQLGESIQGSKCESDS